MDMVKHYFNNVLVLMFGFFFASTALIRLIWRIIRHPVKSITTILPKKRDEMPACLNDPSLGTHLFLFLEDVKIHYVISGDESKPLMLFLHGFPEFWYSWRYQIREFKKDYRVVAIDMRGYGDSDKPSGVSSYHTDKLLGDIKHVIPALGYRSCVLVSHDWGGVLAFQFAAKHPNLVDKLIVMNAPHVATMESYMKSNFEQAKKSWYIMFFQIPWVPELILKTFDYEAVRKIFKGKMSEDDVEAYVYAISRPGGLTSPINYYRAGLRYKRGKYIFNQIETPTLVIWGCKDTALNTDLASLPSKYVTNLTVKYVDDASHWVQMDAPDTVNKLMREWLNQ